MFKAPFSFKGRIRRAEYGLSFLIYFVVAVIAELVLIQVTYKRYSDSSGTGLFALLFWIPCVWFLLAQGAKRSHDLGNSGWFILIPFYAFWLLFADGKSGINEYGPNPKGIGNETEFSFEKEERTF
jgi:uncharacterized membrane protein YhaH (DUF805 family)